MTQQRRLASWCPDGVEREEAGAVSLSVLGPIGGRVENRPENAALAYLLVNPPLTDPTYPYHSISYLASNCHEYGFTGYRCVDANIEALNYLARPESVRELIREAASLRAAIAAKPTLSRADEMRYQVALAGAGLTDDFMQRAIEVFRSPEDFYHYPTYRDAVMACHRWLKLLSLRSIPGLLNGFLLRGNGPVSFVSHTDLADPATLDAITGAFLDYVKGPFRGWLDSAEWRLVGFSVNFYNQLPFALRMAREVRARCPGAVIAFGGTEVCDDVKFARDSASLWKIFSDADVIVPGEGESPLVEILAAIRDGASFERLTGVMTPGADTGPTKLTYENVGRLPAPRYDVWEWAAYWSPEPVVLYSPTRGCYWNKCTFCDYGLNTDRPTSPSRERPAELVLEDLAGIASFARTLYFSVDAMSPRYLRTLAAAMADSGLHLQWSAELRLERTFPKRGVAELLRRAGCVSIAFGYESASQRILDLIDKGVDISLVPTILEHLAEAGIGAQLMGFTGFPSELPEEAHETFAFLARHRSLWTLATVGEFGLTPGSIVAKQPHRFGVAVLDPPASHDLARTLAWRDRATGQLHWPGDPDNRVDPLLKARLQGPSLGRPFVGAVDSGHTVLYFGRNGSRLLPSEDGTASRAALVSEQLVEIPYTSLSAFCSGSDVERAHTGRVRCGQPAGYREMAQWLAAPGSAAPGRSIALLAASGAVTSFYEPPGDAEERVLDGLRILVGLDDSPVVAE